MAQKGNVERTRWHFEQKITLLLSVLYYERFVLRKKGCRGSWTKNFPASAFTHINEYESISLLSQPTSCAVALLGIIRLSYNVSFIFIQIKRVSI